MEEVSVRTPRGSQIPCDGEGEDEPVCQEQESPGARKDTWTADEGSKEKIQLYK